MLGVAADSLSVTGVLDSVSATRSTYQKKTGFLSSRTTRTASSLTDQIVVGSVLSGSVVDVRAAGAVDVLGSALVAGRGLSIAAGGPVTIGALADADRSSKAVSVNEAAPEFPGQDLTLM